MDYFKGLKSVCLLTGFLILGIILIGCANEAGSVQQESTMESNETGSKDSEADTFIFTDSADREVELPKDITKIAPSGSLAQIVLYTVAPDKLIGWASPPADSVTKYYNDKYLDLPAFGSYFGDTFNLEALIKAGPDVIIDVGEAKGSMKEDMDEIQETTGIPTIFIEAGLESLPDAYRTLGDILNEEVQAKALADYSEETLEDAKEISESIPDNERVSLYFGMYESGLNTNGKGSFHSEMVEFVGVENVAVLDSAASKGGGNEVTMEQLLLWDPEISIFTADSVYEPVTEGDELWKDLEAVQNDKLYEIPDEPYNWLSFPPSVNRILGVKWLGNLAYPDLYDYDMVQETQNFYNLFYHYDLRSEEHTSELQSRGH